MAIQVIEEMHDGKRTNIHHLNTENMISDTEKWERLKKFVATALNGNPGDNGHGIKRAFLQINELMRLLDNNDADDVIVDNMTFRFKGCDDRNILSGRKVIYDDVKERVEAFSKEIEDLEARKKSVADESQCASQIIDGFKKLSLEPPEVIVNRFRTCMEQIKLIATKIVAFKRNIEDIQENHCEHEWGFEGEVTRGGRDFYKCKKCGALKRG